MQETGTARQHRLTAWAAVLSTALALSGLSMTGCDRGANDNRGTGATTGGPGNSSTSGAGGSSGADKAGGSGGAGQQAPR